MLEVAASSLAEVIRAVACGPAWIKAMYSQPAVHDDGLGESERVRAVGREVTWGPTAKRRRRSFDAAVAASVAARAPPAFSHSEPAVLFFDNLGVTINPLIEIPVRSGGPGRADVGGSYSESPCDHPAGQQSRSKGRHHDAGPGSSLYADPNLADRLSACRHCPS